MQNTIKRIIGIKTENFKSELTFCNTLKKTENLKYYFLGKYISRKIFLGK